MGLSIVGYYVFGGQTVIDSDRETAVVITKLDDGVVNSKIACNPGWMS